MASSQVEIATSSPFGCAVVHNRRNPSFQNNLNKLVNSCIPNDTSRHIDFADLWVHRPQWQSTTTVADNECDNNNNKNPIHYKDKWAKAREMVFSVDHSGSTQGGSGGASNFQKQSESPVEVSNLGGVSSLVQKWRGFEAMRSRSISISRTSTTTTMFQDNPGADPPTPAPSPSLNEDYSFGDWESDRTTLSGPPSSRSRDSDATEIERLRVADIIKKLTDNDVVCDSPPRVRTSSDQSEQRCFSPVVNSPRIRGRQAFNDLLMQIERDRNKELQGLVARKPVSKFSHRGRIQALLRFRFLRRGMEPMQPPVMHIRERVNLSAQNGSLRSGCCHKELMDNTSTTQNVYVVNQQGNENRYNEVTDSKRCPEIRTDKIQDSEGSVTSKQHDVCQSSHKVNEDMQEHVRLFHSYENLGHEISPFSILIRQEANWENNNHSLAKSAQNDTTFHSTGINSREKTESPYSIKTSVHNKEKEDTNHQVTKSNNNPIGDCEEPSSYHKDEPANNPDLVNTTMYWVSDVSNPEVEWEELQSDNQEQEGSNREWIDEVSRPRSDWEGLRRARYEEMLDPFLDNEEIRVLLGRRSVSTFLSSVLREKIDQVMVSRAQGQQTLKNDQTQEEKHEIRLSEQVVVSDRQEEEEGEYEQDEGENYNDNFDEYEEVESSVGQHYNESDDYMDQITTSPPESWPQNQGHESSDYSYQVASPSTQQSSSNYYSQNSRPNSSDSAHPAIDMELIYDLRGHMEQLHQEMSELRKSIKSCTDMQIKLQRSIKKEVATALHHSEIKNGRRNTVKKVTSGGRCCVCCKMQVDSLLYRCGHMCTCFKCAHKLHWSSGKCPICRAPILDVVRTYSNHS